MPLYPPASGGAAVIPALTAGPTPAGLGLLLETLGINECNASSGGITDQRSIWMLVTATASGTVTKLGTLVTTAGVTVDGAGLNGLGLFSEAGVLMSHTADMSAAFGSTGIAEASLLAAQSVVAGTNYYINVVSAFTGTQPQFANGNGGFFWPTVNAHLSCVYNSNYTAWANFTPGSQSVGQSWFYAYGR